MDWNKCYFRNDGMYEKPKQILFLWHFSWRGKSRSKKRYYNFFEQLFVNHIPYSLLIKKEIFKKVGNYDEGMKLGYEDWEFNIRLAKNGLFPERLNSHYFTIELQKMVY